MRRLLLGFVFSIALFAAGTASALVITSGEAPLLGHEGRSDSIVMSFSESVVRPEIQLGPFQFLMELPHIRPPFEWPDTEWLHELDTWKGKFPFFSHFPLDLFRDWHERREDRSGDPVPEPSTALLFGAGLLGLGLVGRRRS
jgi:hypothetical protein